MQYWIFKRKIINKITSLKFNNSFSYTRSQNYQYLVLHAQLYHSQLHQNCCNGNNSNQRNNRLSFAFANFAIRCVNYSSYLATISRSLIHFRNIDDRIVAYRIYIEQLVRINNRHNSFQPFWIAILSLMLVVIIRNNITAAYYYRLLNNI